MQATIVSVLPALFAKRTVFNGGLPLLTAHFCNMRSSNGHTSCKGMILLQIFYLLLLPMK